MATWIKWWKDKTFMTVLAIALLTMLIGFLSVYFLEYGWIITIVSTVAGGISIRKIVTNRIIKELEKEEDINKKV
jgi:CHASE2 domain-containing sensor protein